VLLVSIIHSFVDDLTLLGLVSNSQQNLLPSPDLSFFPSLSVYHCPCACNSIRPLLYLFIPACAYIYYSACINVSYPVKSSHYKFLFQILDFLLLSPFLNTFLLMFPSVLLLSPRLPPLLNTPLSLVLSLCLSISVFSPSLALCCLNKVAFIRMSRNPNKPNKRYGRENLPAEEGGSYRASLCVPACQLAMPPTADPSPNTHTHSKILPSNPPLNRTHAWHSAKGWHLTWPKGE